MQVKGFEFAGERLLGWLFSLHSAEALGLAGRLAWTACGTAPALLFATGAWLWWRRQVVRRRCLAPPARRPDPFPTREGACE